MSEPIQSPKTNREWFDALKRIECPDSTPRTESPLVFDRGDLSRIWDTEGNEYIDFCAGFGALSLGHNSDVWKNTLQESVSNQRCLQGYGDVAPTTAKIELVQLLKNLSPPHLTHVSLSVTGGQAVETAIKTSQIVTGKAGVICFDHGYHGLDMGLLPYQNRNFFSEGLHQASSHTVFCDYNCDADRLATAFEELKNKGHSLAAILVEPILGRGGIVPAQPGFLEILREFASSHNALLIFDEVFTGCGRSGRMTFANHVPADLVCLGKALGGGMPISACLGTQDTLGAWQDSGGEARHTGTFFGHSFSCQHALETLKVISKPEFLSRTNSMFQICEEILADCGHFPINIRGAGMMIGIAGPESFGVHISEDLRNTLDDVRVFAIPSGTNGEVLSLSPALNVERDLFVKGCKRISQCIKSYFEMK